MPVPVKIDEDLPAEIPNLVDAAGHDAKTVYVQGYTGMPDVQLWPKIPTALEVARRDQGRFEQ